MKAPASAERWLVIADDLTGAADCAVAFAKRRLSARVIWSDAHDATLQPPVVLAIDAGSRALDAGAARVKHTALLRQHGTAGMRVFKKIDSTLRGHPGEEIAALFDVMLAQAPGTRLVVAPAFPATGRVTRGAHVHVHGSPLEFTEFRPRDADAARANVVHLLEAAGIPAVAVPLETIRGGETVLRAALTRDAGPLAAVCDAETESDLDHIAAASLGPRPVLLVGSAGLAHALARRISPGIGPRTEPMRIPPSRHGALVVAGSQAQATRVALRELESLPGIERMTLSASMLNPMENSLSAMQARIDIAEKLAQGTDLVVDLAAPDAAQPFTPADEQLFAGRLAQRVVPFATHASALVATGGETAAALFARCGITGIQLVDEIEHGIALGLTLGGLAVPVVTKAGGFGDAGSLRRIVERLRFIRGSGTVA